MSTERKIDYEMPKQLHFEALEHILKLKNRVAFLEEENRQLNERLKAEEDKIYGR